MARDFTLRDWRIIDDTGSVRQVIDANASVVCHYTYGPFGEMKVEECNETVSNPFKFTGQYFDSETGQYYFRARQYEPPLMRFTTYDPFEGSYQQPMTLHRYLYCLNDPLNRTDPSGELWGALEDALGAATGIAAYYSALDIASRQGSWENILGSAILVNDFREMVFNTRGLLRDVGRLAFHKPGIVGLMLGKKIYGKNCGTGGSDTWDDPLDQACHNHDACYAGAKKSGTGGLTNPSSASLACDRQLCMEAIGADCHDPRVKDTLSCEAAKTAIAAVYCTNGQRSR